MTSNFENENHELFKTLLKKYRPDIDFIFEKTEKGLEVSFNSICFVMNEKETWKHLKKRIDKFLLYSQKEIRICKICNDQMGTFKNQAVNCNECCNQHCHSCYISIFKNNEGQSVCPFCRFTVGEKMPKFMIEFGLIEMNSHKF